MFATNRESAYHINPVILHRHSPRAFSGAAVSADDLSALLEAASWAPSSFNNQPWRFVYATKRSASWDKFFSWINQTNQTWIKQADVLLVLLSRNNFTYDNRPSRTHSFDAGAAWENLALEAVSRNLMAHAIEGFDDEKVRQDLKIPDNYTVEVMIAVGQPVAPEAVAGEKSFSNRKKITEVTSENEFKFD